QITEKCVDGDRRCKAGAIDVTQVCHQEQWQDEVCPNAGEVCFVGYCVTCRPDDTRCKDAFTLQTCASDGSAWTDTACAPPAQCTGSAPALCKVCNPGDRQCKNGTTAQICRPDASGWDDLPCPG